MRKIVIALSGPPGTGTSTVGRILARKLKIEYFSPGKFFKKESKQKNETNAALDRLKTRQGASRELHEYIDNLQIQKAKRGNVLLEGTLSIHFLKDLSNLKIWLYADIDERAKRTVKRDKLTLTEAKMKIIEREKIERAMFEKLYGFDYFDQEKDADLVVNTTRLTVNEVVNKIFYFVRRKQASNS